MQILGYVVLAFAAFAVVLAFIDGPRTFVQVIVIGFSINQRMNPHPKPVRCEEDMPCWDCTTMGNKVCGPQVDIGTAIVSDTSTTIER